jgi:hypothetical protein
LTPFRGENKKISLLLCKRLLILKSSPEILLNELVAAFRKQPLKISPKALCDPKNCSENGLNMYHTLGQIDQ